MTGVARKVDACRKTHVRQVLAHARAFVANRTRGTNARTSGVPIAIVNIGPTRGDDLATLKVEGPCSEVLQGVLGRVSAR